MAINWFRIYHGLCTDPKLHEAAAIAGVKRPVAIAGWIAVLERASDSHERGTLRGMSGSTLGFMIGVSEQIGERLLAAFRRLGMVIADAVAAWSKRQFASDDVGSRVKSFRERNCNPLESLETTSQCNVSETPQTQTQKERDSTSDVESPKNLTPTTEILDPSAESCTRARPREAVALNGHPSPRKGRALELELQVIERVEACDPKQRYLVPRWFDEWGAEVVAEAHREAKRHCAKSYVVGMLKEFAHRPAANGFYNVERYRALNIQHHDLIGTPM